MHNRDKIFAVIIKYPNLEWQQLDIQIILYE